MSPGGGRSKSTAGSLCGPGVTGTQEFLISFHCDTPRKLLLLSSLGVYESYSAAPYPVRRSVNAPLKPKSRDKSFPVLYHVPAAFKLEMPFGPKQTTLKRRCCFIIVGGCPPETAALAHAINDDNQHVRDNP